YGEKGKREGVSSSLSPKENQVGELMNRLIFTLLISVAILIIGGCKDNNAVNDVINSNEPDTNMELSDATKLIWIYDQTFTKNLEPQVLTEFNRLLLNKGADFVVEFVGVDAVNSKKLH